MSYRRTFSVTLKALVGVGFTVSHFAFSAVAATPDNSASNKTLIKVDQQLDSMSKEKTGKLLVVVFKDGVPASGIAVKTSKGVLKTNSAGVISSPFPAGSEQKLEIEGVDEKIPVKIVLDQESQVTVNLLSDKNSDVAVEAAQENITAPVSSKMGTAQFKVSAPSGGLHDVTVLFSGVDGVYKTDPSGEIKTDIPEGNYAVSFFHPNYQTYTLSDYKVVHGQVSQVIPVQLKPASNELEEVLVLAPKIKGSLSSLVEVRKQSSAVTDVLGAEQMARNGDSDAAASLRRVTGLTLVGGKYVYVRGLGERYSGVQMNQFSLPSPEPSRRVVPLDLFPVSIMESIIVQKSYSPDLQGEFGGGVIQLRTRSLPEKFFFRGNISAVSQNASGNQLTYAGGSKDWLGMDDGTREMPAPVKSVINEGKKVVDINSDPKGISPEKIKELALSFPVNYNTERKETPSMPGMSLSMGTGWKFSNVKVGTAGSALYGQSSENIDRTSYGYRLANGAGKLERDFARTTEYSEVETRLAGSYDLGVELFNDHKIIASTFLLRNTTNFAQIDQTDSLTAPGNYLEATTLDFIERQLWTRYLKGEHTLTKVVGHPIKLDWRLGQADATRDSKDRRQYAYNVTSSSKSIASDTLGNQRFYSELTDDTQEMAMDLTVPFQAYGREFVKFKMGVNRLEKNRKAGVQRFFLDDRDTSGINTGADPNSVFSKSNIENDTFTLKSSTTGSDSYRGDQTVDAQYIMSEVNPTSQWTLQAGFRREESIQNVATYDYTDPGNPFSTANLSMNDVLPAYSIIWKPTDKLRARLAYSETLARPDFRELSSTGFVDDETGYIVAGNENLKGTVIKNIDHRWEYYFTSDEYASIGLFYKEFENPIEVLFLPGVNLTQTFKNAPGASNYGIELEGRMGLRHVSRFLRRWTVLSNVTFIESEIDLGGDQGTLTSASRPLQGQSPYVLNAQLQYDRPNWGFSSTLLYNIIGKRITEVGTLGIPDTYEQPFGQLDFVASQVIQKNWTLSFRARNLLDPEVESTQGIETVRSFKRGRVFSAVLGANF